MTSYSLDRAFLFLARYLHVTSCVVRWKDNRPSFLRQQHHKVRAHYVSCLIGACLCVPSLCVMEMSWCGGGGVFP